MRFHKKWIIGFLVLPLVLLTAAGCDWNAAANPDKVKLDPEDPVTITVWHYYNGAQQEAFDALVGEFNDTAGREQGIIVESFSQGNVTDLEDTVLDAVNKKVGAAEVPNVFAAYADTAYAVDQLGLVADLDPYLTDEEEDVFIQSYLEEGRFSEESGLKIFPIAKSTEIMMMNQTDWEKFAQATGASAEELATMEGLVRVAQAYYEWTDGQTPDVPDDGQAFFGRDAVANYVLIGSRQLGQEIFPVEDGAVSLNFEKDIARKLWDHYYVPLVKGYFAKVGTFASDDVKTGDTIAFVGSTSGATYFPAEVIVNDTETYPVEVMVLEAPKFEGGADVAVQQGAGLVVTESGDKEVYASVQFLKWFIEAERDIQFSHASGYLPVTKEANNLEYILETVGEQNDDMIVVLEVALDTVNGNELYTPKAFENGTSARAVLGDILTETAVRDRQAVEEALAAGQTLGEAAEEFISESNFESWYTDVRSQLEQLVN